MSSVIDIVSIDGFGWLMVATVLAGLVRGFTGFGTAMVFMPVAAAVLGPIPAVTAMLVIDFFGPLMVARAAWRNVDKGDLTRLALGAALAMPIGVLFLTTIPEDPFRYAVSGVSLVLLVMLIGGIRYRGAFTPPILFGAGGMGGLLGGAVGLGGPPVIMLYMASPKPAISIRANTLLFLFFTDMGLLITLFLAGVLKADALVTGLVLAIPYALAVMLGTRLFNPGSKTVYRRIAYAVIAISALSSLPLLD